MNILLTTRRERFEQRNPIALLDLASYLRRFGHQVDCYYLDQIQSQSIRDRHYHRVGLSVLQALHENTPVADAIDLARRFRTEVVVGGKWTHTMAEGQRAQLQRQGIQVWLGAGEQFFVPGEIDYAAYPSWDSCDFQSLEDVRADIMSTRGCPYHCHFCHNTEKKISFFSPERTADHIGMLFRLGIKRVFFSDDIFTLDAGHMAKVYEELRKRNIPIAQRNEFFTHVNHIRPETLQWMKAFQPAIVSIGIESGDDRMLGLMGKGFDVETAYQKIKMLYEETRLPIGTLFIIGFPGETEESLQNTLNFIHRIRPFAGSWVSYYQPVRGTKGYEMAMERSKRSKRMKLGRRNTGIPYVDPNVTKKLLFKYHYQMMDFSRPNSMRRRLIYSLIYLLPYRLLAPIRQYRQDKRLKEDMDRTYLLPKQTAFIP
jgi:radical SAM superfamily enzyme YgiQ (UPF0313 family)